MMFTETSLKLDDGNKENQDLRFQLDKQKEVTDKLEATPNMFIKKGSDRYTVEENGIKRETSMDDFVFLALKMFHNVVINNLIFKLAVVVPTNLGRIDVYRFHAI